MSDPNSGPVLAVELAYPLEHDGKKNAPDAVVELPVDMAKQLVRDGRARLAAPASNTTKATGKPAQGGVTGG